MKIEVGRLFLLLTVFYLADLSSTTFSLALGIPNALPSNWAFLISLALSHFVLSFVCTYGMSEKGGATASAIVSAALAYVLFCTVSVSIDLLIRSAIPMAALELGALAGAMTSKSPRHAEPTELPPPPPQVSV